ncbi:hypothetical protein E1B28_010738 [Marasmius oreades]|uniref:Uncharacterized protein n=1 Tax=Marasmius oreades TaxID=181124 RepID=A0A9P7UNU0_9AGAR|nr:uncharacterized protein E1B28_010738 [Marasmius oreades]KAG7089027.1 hypothetical protein E1B28_010738 [Marasmius oreades]
MPAAAHARSPSGNTLSEKYIQDCFHSYLKSSLTQAKVERLLDADILSSAEGDLMITGPALCLYFAALRCTTNPPAVPLPRLDKHAAPMDLSAENCPPTFQSFLQVWSRTVPIIQGFTPEHQHDLARVICNLPPLSTPPEEPVLGVAADLRAVAIEISQRRSFQDRYADDLQAALDSGSGSGNGNGNTPSSPGPGQGGTIPKRASFVPPPSYDVTSPTSSARSRSTLPGAAAPLNPIQPHDHDHDLPPPTSQPSRSRSIILSPTSPAIEFIRETLYAALGDVLERVPSLQSMLNQDPPRAYFASVAFAILDVATTSMIPDEGGSVVGVLGTTLSVDECPSEFRPFMLELGVIGREAKGMEEEDQLMAVEYAQRGGGMGEIPATRMDRVKSMLVNGVGNEQRRREEDEGRGSPAGRAVAFANRVNGLSLALTNLKTFRERQEEVFRVLAGIGG